ncbi:2-polyprenyl-6-methoxyphenol hydroxylase [Micromonospora coriariae]|uniref:2-polyprenyl-6-methoxyphenol hydroxylase n=1 Tax=Micromonospora coriariae TaxID=285665 RepID=A0A1C4URN5_9ACTN|nr:FAD-dependent monooxygenase [Micromonospora coriariae]SCE74366.1 2-polyprenyl-6-methoxyphenol hydroxylase [Micromonospora coriariae]
MRGDGVRVLIVGGGVAGLATVAALRDWGATVDVVERAPGPDDSGTGIYLTGNATRMLDVLGLREPILDVAVEITRQRSANQRGRRLFDIDVAALWQGVGPCASLPRAQLHRALLAGVGDAPIRWGRQPVALAEEGAVIAVEFDDDSTARYDLVIGADGVNSTVRRLAFNGRTARDLGQYAYRWVAPRIDDEPVWSVQLGRGRQFLTIPISDEQTYCYYNDGPVADRPGWRDELGATFTEPAAMMLKALDYVTSTLHAGPNQEVVLDSWSRGPVLLIGDAAHATSPNMAQGAAMALEDAVVLADSLAAAGNIAEALHGYEMRRRPRTDWVLSQTHRRDKATGLPPALRDLVLRRLGEQMFRSNYGPLFTQP